MKVYYKFYCKLEPQLSTSVNVHKIKNLDNNHELKS